MLRITPRAELIFQSRQCRFNRNFWKGFLLACAIHFLLLMTIRIALPPNLDALLPIAPIEVESVLSSTIAAHAAPSPLHYLPRQIPTLLSSHDHLLSLPCLEIAEYLPQEHELEPIKYTPLELLIAEEWD